MNTHSSPTVSRLRFTYAARFQGRASALQARLDLPSAEPTVSSTYLSIADAYADGTEPIGLKYHPKHPLTVPLTGGGGYEMGVGAGPGRFIQDKKGFYGDTMPIDSDLVIYQPFKCGSVTVQQWTCDINHHYLHYLPKSRYFCPASTPPTPCWEGQKGLTQLQRSHVSNSKGDPMNHQQLPSDERQSLEERLRSTMLLSLGFHTLMVATREGGLFGPEDPHLHRITMDLVKAMEAWTTVVAEVGGLGHRTGYRGFWTAIAEASETHPIFVDVVAHAAITFPDPGPTEEDLEEYRTLEAIRLGMTAEDFGAPEVAQ